MRLLSIALAVASTVAIALLGVVAFLRAGYPFELEWMEGGMLQHVERVLAGAPIYVAPSLEFMAYPYTPLFPSAAAALALVLGPGFLAPRLVSIAATLASLLLLGRIASREAGTRLAGLVAAGLFAAAYELTGAWYDVARVDSLALALALAALLLARPAGGAPSTRRAALAGAVLFLAFFAKQSMAGPAAGIALGLLAARRQRPALAAAGAFALLLVASTLWLDARTDGWYGWHVFELLAGHALHRPAVLGFWAELAASLGPAFVIAAWVRATARRAPGAEETPGAGPLVPVVALSLVLSSWVGRMHVGGYANTLIPAAAGAALVLGIAVGRASALPGRRRALVLGAALLQLALLAWDPRSVLPAEEDRAAGEAIVAELGAVEGEVWVPYHGYLAARAGHRHGAHAMPILDLLQGDDRETAQAFVDELVSALAGRRWRMIVLDELSWEQELPPLARAYARTRTLLDPARPGLFRPPSGEPLRPVYVYEPLPE